MKPKHTPMQELKFEIDDMKVQIVHDSFRVLLTVVKRVAEALDYANNLRSSPLYKTEGGSNERSDDQGNGN